MKDELQPTRDANAIFRIALAFLALAGILFVTTAAVQRNSELEQALTVTAAVAFVAGATLGLWGASKLRPDKSLISLFRKLKRTFGLKFSLCRILLHAAIAALLTAAAHYAFVYRATAQAELFARNYRLQNYFEASLPLPPPASYAAILEAPSGASPIFVRLFNDAQRDGKASDAYDALRMDRQREFQNQTVHELGFTREVLRQRLQAIDLPGLQWQPLRGKTVSDFEKSALAKPYFEFVPSSNDKAPNSKILSGGAILVSDFSFCINLVSLTENYEFAVQNGTLFVRNISDPQIQQHWRFDPTQAAYLIRGRHPSGCGTSNPSWFPHSLPLCVLQLLATALLLTAPFFYITRKNSRRSVPTP